MSSSSNDDSLKALGCVGALFMTPTLVVVGTLLRGWVLSVMWVWFVVSTFHTHGLSVVQAIGLSCIANFLIPTASPNIVKDGDTALSAFVKLGFYVIFAPLFALLFGYIVHLFM